MYRQELSDTYCPYCGEPIQLLVDCSIPQQEYVEDCQVCCQPMKVFVAIDEEGLPNLLVAREDE